MSITHMVFAVFLMALVTYLPRAFPIILVNKKINSRRLRSFLYYTPYAVLGAMTFPSILFATNHLFTSVSGTLIAFLLSYREQSLLKVALGAVVTVFLSEWILWYL